MYINSTALNYSDLLNQIKTKAIENGWNTVHDTVDELVLSAPLNACIVGFKESSSATEDYYNFELQAFKSYDSSKPFHEQLGAIPKHGFNGHSSGDCPRLTLSNEPLEYWLSISDRRILIVVKVSNFYVSAYLGLLLPFGSPVDYENPIFVGGNRDSESNIDYRLNRWSETDSGNSNFMFGDVSSAGSAKVLGVDGKWQDVTTSSADASVFPYKIDNGHGGVSELGKTLDGKYPLIQCLVFSKEEDGGRGSWLGALEGVFATSSENNFNENTIDDAYVSFCNVFRSSAGEFFAMEMK
ncbi:TPA: hypothetical protein ACQYFB_004597 [Vibrio parahaemolyticus]